MADATAASTGHTTNSTGPATPTSNAFAAISDVVVPVRSLTAHGQDHSASWRGAPPHRSVACRGDTTDGRAGSARDAEAVRVGETGVAFLIGADHIGDDPAALVLGDNIFHGPGFSGLLHRSIAGIDCGDDGCVLFGYPVRGPQRYGVGEADEQGRLVSIEEKPERPRSDRAITGLYLYDNHVVSIAKTLTPSRRGELEITDVNKAYLAQGRARLIDLGRGFAWFDTGTHESLLQAGQYVEVLENRQGIRIACVEEVALRMGYIDADTCHRLGSAQNSDYGRYVIQMARSVPRP
jgi:glucose-1-phosphate thymidylyltransferase